MARERTTSHTLRRWASYSNSSRWKNTVIKGLEKKRHVHVDDGDIALLYPGEVAAQKIILDAGGL